MIAKAIGRRRGHAQRHVLMYTIAVLLVLLALFLASGCKAVPDRAHDIRTELVSYQAEGGVCKGYVAWDQKREGKRPGVLVVHEWWGMNAYVQRRARMLAELGYTAFAIDLYGNGTTANDPATAGKLMNDALAHMGRTVARFDAAHAVLADHPTVDRDRIGAIGYCLGGAIVLGMARAGKDLDAVVSFHGSLATDSPAKKGAVKARVLACHGADDPFVPRKDVDAFVAEMKAAGADFRFEEYPGAVHAFTSEEATANGATYGLPLRYDAAADAKSWRSMQEVFAAAWK